MPLTGQPVCGMTPDASIYTQSPAEDESCVPKTLFVNVRFACARTFGVQTIVFATAEACDLTRFRTRSEIQKKGWLDSPTSQPAS